MCELTLAYLDPGAGSILLQCLIGVLLGAGLFYRRSLAYVLSLFRRSNRIPDAQSPPTRT